MAAHKYCRSRPSVAALPAVLRAAPAPRLREAVACHVPAWLAMVGTPLGQRIELRGLHRPPFASDDSPGGGGDGGGGGSGSDGGGSDVRCEPLSFEAAAATGGMHERAAAALGAIAAACERDTSAPPADATDASARHGVAAPDEETWRAALLRGLGAPSVTSRQLSAWIVAEWAQSAATSAQAQSKNASAIASAESGALIGACGHGGSPGAALSAALLALTSDAPTVAASASEMREAIAEMQAAAVALVRAFEKAGAPPETLLASSFGSSEWPGGAGAAVGEQAAHVLAEQLYGEWLELLPPTASNQTNQTKASSKTCSQTSQAATKARGQCAAARDSLRHSRRLVLELKEALGLTLGAAAAEGVVRIGQLPPKLNSIVKALMSAVQGAPPAVQRRAAAVLAALLVKHRASGAGGSLVEKVRREPLHP